MTTIPLSPQRGSVVTVCGSVQGEPLYTQMPRNDLPVLYYWLRCENPSGKGAQIRVVSYGDAAKGESREIVSGTRLFLAGILQTRPHEDKQITEVVSQQVTDLSANTEEYLQHYGARAALLGDIIEVPQYTLLGAEKIPYVKFMLRCAHPKGHHAEIALVHFGYMAATYATQLREGMRIVAGSEIRTHFYYPPEKRRGDYVLQFVTDSVQIVSTKVSLHVEAATTEGMAAR